MLARFRLLFNRQWIADLLQSYSSVVQLHILQGYVAVTSSWKCCLWALQKPMGPVPSIRNDVAWQSLLTCEMRIPFQKCHRSLSWGGLVFILLELLINLLRENCNVCYFSSLILEIQACPFWNKTYTRFVNQPLYVNFCLTYFFTHHIKNAYVHDTDILCKI